MHIPDGFLSPSTCVACAAVALPVLGVAMRSIQRRELETNIPKIAVSSAMGFLIMMFNVPLPGGTTGHATGATFLAILLGPWQAVLALTVTLMLQAILFGDGGILALGSNILTIAILLPLAGYGIYFIMKTWIRAQHAYVHGIIAGIAAYFAVNLSALATAILLGVQPLLFYTPTGQPIYFPFPPAVTVPAMMVGHLTVIGFIEMLLTGTLVYWTNKRNITIYSPTDTPRSFRSMLAILFMVLFMTPLGLLAPGTAWGEWSREELSAMNLTGIPKGFDTFNSFWRAPFPDYELPFHLPYGISYILSGVISLVIIACFIWIVQTLLTLIVKRKNTNIRSR